LILVMTLLPLVTGVISGTSRYVLAAWPGFGVMADIPPRFRPWLLGLWAAASIVLSVAVIHDWAEGLLIA
jgi:hypothetical protein